MFLKIMNNIIPIKIDDFHICVGQRTKQVFQEINHCYKLEDVGEIVVNVDQIN